MQSRTYIRNKNTVTTPIGQFLFENRYEELSNKSLFRGATHLADLAPYNEPSLGTYSWGTITGYLCNIKTRWIESTRPGITVKQFAKLKPYLISAIKNRLKDKPPELTEKFVAQLEKLERELYGTVSNTKNSAAVSMYKNLDSSGDANNGFFDLGLNEKDIAVLQKIPAQEVLTYVDVGQQMQEAGIETTIRRAATRDQVKFKLALLNLQR